MPVVKIMMIIFIFTSTGVQVSVQVSKVYQYCVLVCTITSLCQGFYLIYKSPNINKIKECASKLTFMVLMVTLDELTHKRKQFLSNLLEDVFSCLNSFWCNVLNYTMRKEDQPIKANCFKMNQTYSIKHFFQIYYNF